MFTIRSRAVFMTFLMALTGSSVYGNQAGAPKAACDTMTPGHGVDGQTSAAPYQLVAKASFGCKETVKLTLNSSTNEQFKGFLCQARTADVTKYKTTGTLRAISGGNNFCDGTGSATHVSSSPKSAIEFEWTATEYNASVPVNFVCTVVKSYNTFWVKGPKVTVVYDGKGGNCLVGAAQSIVGTWTTWAAIAGLMLASVL